MRRLFLLGFLVASAGVGPAWGGEFEFFQPLDPPRQFQLMAHRGEAGQAPENTRAALRRCIEDGLEWAEVDVRLTSDGQHLLAHDAEIRGVTNEVWKVAEHTLAESGSLDVGAAFAKRFAGEHLLALKDCFELAKGKLNLYLDCKQVDPERLSHEILEAGMERQVVVYDRMENLHRVTQASGGKVATMAKWRPGEAIEGWRSSNHLAAVEIDAPDVTPAITQAFHDAGVRVESKNLGEWDTPGFWDRVMNANVDWIQTDVPEEALARALWRRLPRRPVRISLHRGANRYAPENTTPAYEKAIRMGVDFVEFDVRTTKDGKWYLLHDGNLNRTTDGVGPILDANSSVVSALSAGAKFGAPYAGVKVPSLDEFLDVVSGRIELYFDAKAIAPEALAAAVQRHGMAERTVVYQSAAFLKRLKEIDPRIRALPPLRSLAQLDELANGLKPYAVDADWNILSKEMIERCHQAGILVFSDSLGSHEHIENYLQAIDWGIDLIQTDHPLRVMRALELWMSKRN